MFNKNKYKCKLKRTIKGLKHRNVYLDMNICDPNIIPEIIPESDCVKILIDGKEIILTYGQYAYLHISTSMVYGNI